MSTEDKKEIKQEDTTEVVEALSDKKDDIEQQLSDKDKKEIEAQLTDLSSKVEKASKEIVKVFRDNDLSPLQSLMLLKAISDGIIEMMNQEVQKRQSSANAA